MENFTINWDNFNNLSYKTNLGKSLKNTLRKFNKEDLVSEINKLIFYLMINESQIPYEKRIKSFQSCMLKYDKYYPSTEVEKVFNDILGIRIIIDDYDIVKSIETPKEVKIVDMTNGKSKDDGYRAIHMYYQKNHFYYPIELQFMTPKDRQFNEWLHIYLYKYTPDHTIGAKLRTLYEKGHIVNEKEFQKEMKKLNVLSDC